MTRFTPYDHLGESPKGYFRSGRDVGATSGGNKAASRSTPLRLIALTVLTLTAILSGAVGYGQLSTARALRAPLLPEHSAPAFHRVHTTASEKPAEQRTAAASLMQGAGLADALRITPSVRTSTYIVEGL